MERYPCRVCCYRLVARNGLPPHPEDKPIEVRVVHSEKDADQAKRELSEAHPESWTTECPLE